MGVVYLCLFVLASNTLLVQSKVCSNFLGCTQYFYKTRPPIINLPKVTEICQYKNKGTASIFATLYDTAIKIPIYSAYVLYLNAGTCPRPTTWYIEEDLTTEQQAIDNDYLKSNYHRGHLAPNCYFAPDDRAATFYLTNAVPQNGRFNTVKWKNEEQMAMKIMKNNCSNGYPYFITGAIPGNGVIIRNVNIPSYMYTAACCEIRGENEGEQSFSFGYIGSNERDSMMEVKNVVELANTIQNRYTPRIGAVEIFAGNCYYNNAKSKKILEQLKSITTLKNG